MDLGPELQRFMRSRKQLRLRTGSRRLKVEVSEVQSDDIETRLTTAVSAGDLSTLPDIFLMQDNSFQKYATNYPDIFTDLTDSVSTLVNSHPQKLLTLHWMERTTEFRLTMAL